jgi:MFS family permease
MIVQAFMGLAALWSISAGVNGGWATLLDVFLEHKQSQVQIGWIGFGGSLAGAAGGVVAGVLIDRFDQSLKWGMVTVSRTRVSAAVRCIFQCLCVSPDCAGVLLAARASQLYAGATAAAAVFLVFVYLLFRELQFVPIFLSVLFCGLFANAAAPITLELASELTFPVGEETSATLLVVFFSVVQLAFIEGSSVISPEVGTVSIIQLCTACSCENNCGPRTSSGASLHESRRQPKPLVIDLVQVMNWVNAGVLGAATIGLLLVPGDSMRKAVDVADVKGGNPGLSHKRRNNRF